MLIYQSTSNLFRTFIILTSIKKLVVQIKPLYESEFIINRFSQAEVNTNIYIEGAERHIQLLNYWFTVFLNLMFFFFKTTSSESHIRLEFLIDLSKLQMLWYMCAKSTYNCLQFAQQLIAYGLLIWLGLGVDSHLNHQTLHNFSILFHRVSHHI